MDIAVSIGLVGRSSLTSVAYRAAKLSRLVNHGLVSGKDTVADYSLLSGSHSYVTRDAAIRNIETGIDDLSQVDIHGTFRGAFRRTRRALYLPPFPSQVFVRCGHDQQDENSHTRPQQEMFIPVHKLQCFGQSAGDQ